jgi:kynureninase
MEKLIGAQIREVVEQRGMTVTEFALLEAAYEHNLAENKMLRDYNLLLRKEK